MSSVQQEWLSEAEQAAVTGLSEDLVSRDLMHPVGPRILKQSFLGARGALLAQLEASIKQVLPPASLLELECSVDEGQLAWWATRANHQTIRQQVEPVLAKAQGQLAAESWRLALHESAEDSPVLLLGQGGRLLDILAENDFNEIVIRIPADIREDFMRNAGVEQLPGLSDCFLLKKSSFHILQFRSVELAQSALKHLKDVATLYSINVRDIGPWRALSGCSSQQAAFELRVSIERRRDLDRAFIRFRSELEAMAAAHRLAGRLLSVRSSTSYLSEYVSIQPNKKDDKASLFCWIRDRNSTQKKAVTEESLLEAVRRQGLDPVGVRIPKEKEYQSSPEDQDRVREDISRVFTDSWTCSRTDFSIDLKKAYPKDFHWIAWLRFKSSAAGLRCAQFCEVLLVVIFCIILNYYVFLYSVDTALIPGTAVAVPVPIYQHCHPVYPLSGVQARDISDTWWGYCPADMSPSCGIHTKINIQLQGLHLQPD